MADTDALKENILATLEKNAQAGIRGYTQDDLSVQFEPLGDLLKAYKELSILPRAGSFKRLAAEVSDP